MSVSTSSPIDKVLFS